MKEHGRIHLGQPILGGGVVVQFPAARGAGKDYNECTMRPDTSTSLSTIGDFRLGDWEVRPSHNRLVSDSEERHLEPKAMDLLVFLAASGSEVVSKNALIDVVWEGRIISEGTLTNTIAELRRVLGDDARNPRFIETIPKRGYRLVAAVETVSPSIENEAQVSTEPRKAVVFTAVVGILLALTAALWVVLQTRNRPIDPELVLVAPFVNRTGDDAFDAVALLARDRLVAKLSESRIAGAVPAAIDGSGDDIDELCAAGIDSGAGLVIGGTLYLHEGEVEVQAMLADVRESALLIAIPASIAERERVSEALDEVVARTLGAVATHLRAHGHFQLMSHAPVFEAYQEFIAGSEVFAIDKLAAIRHLERAVTLDPNFTSAHFRLAAAYRSTGRRAEATDLLNRVDQSRANLTEFERLWLDYFLMSWDRRRDEALALLRRIESVVPDDPLVQHMIIGNAYCLNRPREVTVAMSVMVGGKSFEGLMNNQLLAKTFRRCSMAYHILGQHEEGLRIAQQGLEVFPTDRGLLASEARALIALDDHEAFDNLIKRELSVATGPVPVDLLVEAAATSRAIDRPDMSRDLARRALSLMDDRPTDGDAWQEGVLRARALVFAGELDTAQNVLEGLRSMTDASEVAQWSEVSGWIGAVAARRGDLEIAEAMDRVLAEIDAPSQWGWPTHYRAAIAAWLGHRDRAMDLLRQSRAEGWVSFSYLHDDHRVLFEPLEAMEDYQALLHPEG